MGKQEISEDSIFMSLRRYQPCVSQVVVLGIHSGNPPSDFSANYTKDFFCSSSRNSSSNFQMLIKQFLLNSWNLLAGHYNSDLKWNFPSVSSWDFPICRAGSRSFFRISISIFIKVSVFGETKVSIPTEMVSIFLILHTVSSVAKF